MPLSEFQLIERFFADARVERGDVILGTGDDAAQVRVVDDRHVLIDIETRVEGSDFQREDDPRSVGHIGLAHALARLAARGAEPAWATLSLTLPEVDEYWLRGLSDGMLTLAERHQVQLVGGDTTRGPRTLILHTHGLVPLGQCVPLADARAGDLIYVTGTLGDTGLAVLAMVGEVLLPKPHKEGAFRRLNLPEPPIAQGLALRGIASAADVLTDGLARNLGALLRSAGVGATVQVERLPVSTALEAVFELAGGWNMPLHAGEPCELVFTVAQDRQAELERHFAKLGSQCTWIGTVERQPGLRCRLDDGREYYLSG